MAGGEPEAERSGLFDMLGNAWNGVLTDTVTTQEQGGQGLRGHADDATRRGSEPPCVAWRGVRRSTGVRPLRLPWHDQPDDRDFIIGFRPARTYP